MRQARRWIAIDPDEKLGRLRRAGLRHASSVPQANVLFHSAEEIGKSGIRLLNTVGPCTTHLGIQPETSPLLSHAPCGFDSRLFDACSRLSTHGQDGSTFHSVKVPRTMMKSRGTKKLTDFTASELATVETNERQRMTLPDWHQNWIDSSTLPDAANLTMAWRTHLNRQLAEEHRHGRLFADAAEDYMSSEPRAKRGARSLRAQWNVLKPLLAGIRASDVNDRLLAVAAEYGSVTFVQEVLRFSRRQDRARNPKRIPSSVDFPTPATLRDEWIDWIHLIRPTGFVTILMPLVAVSEGGRQHQRQREPEFYIRLVTRRAEELLWGGSVPHVRNQNDRCLWIGVREVEDTFERAAVKGTFLHFHLLVRLPTRPMLHETTGVQSDAERLAHVQKALVQASQLTPEAFAARSALDGLRTENDAPPPPDIQVKPYERRDAGYVVKKLERAGTLTDRNPTTLAAANCVVMPNTLRLPNSLAALSMRVPTTPTGEHPNEHQPNEEDCSAHPHRTVHRSISTAPATSLRGRRQQGRTTTERLHPSSA